MLCIELGIPSIELAGWELSEAGFTGLMNSQDGIHQPKS